MKMTIGSHSNNDITLNDDSVSAHHAELDYHPSEPWLLKDLESKNGSYVNGRRIRSAVITVTDELRLGRRDIDITSIKEQCHILYQERKTDYSAEYQEVMTVFKEFQDKKDKLIDKPKTALYIRLGLMAVLALVWVFSQGSFGNLYTLFIVGLAVLTVLSGLLGPSPIERNQKMDLLKLEYEDQLKCPKCGHKMINQGYTYWQGKSGCNHDKCNAVFK